MSTALVFFAARLFASTTRRARPPARGSAEEDAEVYHTNETKKEIRQSHSSHRARRRSDPSRRHHTPRRPARTRHSRTQKNPTRPNPQTHRPSPPAPSPRRTHDAPCASKRIDKIPLKQILPSRVPVDVARAFPRADDGSPLRDPLPSWTGLTNGRARRPAMTRRARMRTSNRERPTCRYFLRTLVRRTARRPV